MSHYIVKKGKYYFRGNKMQPAFIQFGFILLGIILTIITGSWWYIFGSLIAFICLNSLMVSETVSETKRVFFSANCIYKLTENYDQVNKLYGFSEGFHHWNSARIGWRCIDNTNIELLAYAYVDGKRIIKPMIKFPIETWALCNIQNQTNKYVFKAVSLNNQSITISIDKVKKSFVSNLFKLFMYRLFPYFGGKIAAPHDMDLIIIS